MRLRTMILLAGVSWLIILSAVPVSAQLFSEVKSLSWEREVNFPVQPEIKRGRVVQVDFDLLESAREIPDEPLLLNLFEDIMFEGRVKTVEIREFDSYTLSGNLSEYPDSSFILVVEKDAVVANIRVPGQPMYQLRYLNDQLHQVLEIDPSQLGACGVDSSWIAKQQKDLPKSIQGLPPTRADSGTSIEVLVVFTAAARMGAGSANAMAAEINLAVADANSIYSNSLINTRLLLLAAAEVDYTEYGDSDTDLYRLQQTDDGYMDTVHTLRDAVGADLVCLFTESIEPDVCGVAYVMLSPDSIFNDELTAFSLVRRDCASANHTFAHEIGHNLACDHDRDNAGILRAFPYAFGHRFNGNSGTQWRTVMSYSPGTKISYFSNPNITFDGQPVGVPVGQAGEAYNALVINDTASVVANYRQSLQEEVTGSKVWDHYR